MRPPGEPEVVLPLERDVTEQVRRFYDSIGWRRIGPGLFQNATYEDLRPVSQEYIQRCHRRVGRHLRPAGAYLLDAGSGPIQYPEYLEYSAGYRYRVCLDLSLLALQEARQRIGTHGLYVIADIAHLPFSSGTMDGVVSLHTIHHLAPGDQPRAFDELARVLLPGATAAVVYSWGRNAPLEAWTRIPVRLASSVIRAYSRWRGARPVRATATEESPGKGLARGTYTFKHNYRWLAERLGHLPEAEILVWRSVGTGFLRAFIHRRLGGRMWLRGLFWIEDRAPHWFGRVGQYPLIVVRRPGGSAYARDEG
jgi:SAM-dependent methyltransferase